MHSRVEEIGRWPWLLLALAITPLPGCLPVAASAIISHYQTKAGDEKVTVMVRRAYIVSRQADGKSHQQITTEIAKIDRTWEIDLALSRGDLMASATPNQMMNMNCMSEDMGDGTLEEDPLCLAKRDAQLQVLKEEGVTLTKEERAH